MGFHLTQSSARRSVPRKSKNLRSLRWAALALATTPAEWSRAIRDALRPAANTPERRGRRQAVARQHDWSLLVAQIARTMAQRLGQDFPERLMASHWTGIEPYRSHKAQISLRRTGANGGDSKLTFLIR